jgi:hypothetical protein
LSPRQIGKFKIEPSQIKVKGQTYSTQAFEIEVTQGKATPKNHPEEKPLTPEQNETKPELPQITL